MASISLSPVVCLLIGLVLLNLKFETARTLEVPCPARAASARIEADQVRIILRSPKNQRDIPIDYDGDDWMIESKATINKLPKLGFNSSNPSVIYLHAYTQSANSQWLQEVRRLYDKLDGAERGQLNLMFFDWSYFSRYRYDNSASWVPRLGQVLGKFLKQLKQELAPDDATMMGRTHLVSYSLSTHIAGQAGRYLASSGGDSLIGRITALDPTGVCFHTKNSQFASQYSLKPSDARLVVARHYDMGTLGSSRLIGGVDVFVNGGKNQPSPARNTPGLSPLARTVGFRPTSHSIASLNEVQEQVDECRNIAYACSSYKDFLSGECADCGQHNAKCIDLNTMDATRAMRNGQHNSHRYKLGTSMYIKTSQDSGCIHHYQAVLRLKSEPTQAQRALLEDSLSFLFTGNQRAKVNNQPGGESRSYTALLTTENDQLADSKQITMQLHAAGTAFKKGLKQDRGQKMHEVANMIDHLELNYMSHYSAEERAKRSAKFCVPPDAKDKDILRKC